MGIAKLIKGQVFVFLVLIMVAGQGRAAIFPGGTLFVAHAQGHSRGIDAVDPTTGAKTLVSNLSGFVGEVYDLAIDGSGRLLATNARDTIYQIDLSTGAVSVFASGGFLISTQSIAVAGSGDIFVSDEAGAGGRIVKINPVTAAQTLVSSNQFFDTRGPWGIAVDQAGFLYASGGFQGNAVVKIDPSTGIQTLLTSGGNLSNPTNLAFDAQGNLVSVNEGFGVVKINSVSGSQSPISTGGLFNLPTNIEVAANGDIYIADLYGADLLRVNPVTGAQAVVAEFNGEQPRALGIMPQNAAAPAPSTLTICAGLLASIAAIQQRKKSMAHMLH